MDACVKTFFRGVVICLVTSVVAAAESYETANFVVTAENQQTARVVAEAAEACRVRLSEHWLGRRMPRWSRPCRVSVNVGSMGAGGSTTFQFVNGEVLNWRMKLQGSLERILDSVLPHEVNHTVFASYFRRPLPRWADEGAATLFEHSSEQRKQLHLLQSVIGDPAERYSLSDLLGMKEYPEDLRRMLILYAQGYALADFLVQQGGRAAYLKFLSEAETAGWEASIRGNFDHAGVESLERNWLAWIRAGMPRLNHGESGAVEMVALQPGAAVGLGGAGSKRAVIRSQNPDQPAPSGAGARAGAGVGVGGGAAVKPEAVESGVGASKAGVGARGYREFRLQAPAPRRRLPSGGTQASVPWRGDFEPTMHRGLMLEPSAGGRGVLIEPAPLWAGFAGQRPVF
jgi:hypothetical protein